MGIRVAVQKLRRVHHRPDHAGGRAQGIGVYGDVQGHRAAVDVAAVGIVCLIQHALHQLSLRIYNSLARGPQRRQRTAAHRARAHTARASAAVTYSRRQARGMSARSTARTGSPMAGFLWSTP